MPTTLSPSGTSRLRHAMDRLEIALPASGEGLEQDEEYVVVRSKGGWKQVRLHDYPEVFRVPGLYERWVYDILGCQSPRVVASLLGRALAESGARADGLTVLDLGAGNGCVAEELRRIGVERMVGVDIHPEAAVAAERDRPGLYADYVVGDLTSLDSGSAGVLGRRRFNAMVCVAALGFGDIPPEVFGAAFGRIEDGGWAAFTIKTDFTTGSDGSGFGALIGSMLERGSLELARRETFTHRRSTAGRPILYDAFIGRKRGPIGDLPG